MRTAGLSCNKVELAIECIFNCRKNSFLFVTLCIDMHTCKHCTQPTTSLKSSVTPTSQYLFSAVSLQQGCFAVWKSIELDLSLSSLDNDGKKKRKSGRIFRIWCYKRTKQVCFRCLEQRGGPAGRVMWLKVHFLYTCTPQPAEQLRAAPNQTSTWLVREERKLHK